MLRGVAAFWVEDVMVPELWSDAVPAVVLVFALVVLVALVVLELGVAVVVVAMVAKAGAARNADSAIALANWVRIMRFLRGLALMWQLSRREVAGPAGTLRRLASNAASRRLTPATKRSYSKG